MNSSARPRAKASAGVLTRLSNAADALPTDYGRRVYAGVLGKVIGVYLGRPFEQWSHERILRELGEVHYYVHDRLNKPLVVTDDDITGTFTFIRAMSDNGFDPALTPAQIGHTWLNYIVENKTILWWGGMGMSTEHTAFLRLQQGIEAPASGSIATNGRTVAEQIGAQIFIDGWGMICPGEPAQAADFARRAGSVSHDGEAIYGAQVIAAMEAAAFVETDMGRLLDTAVALIPADSTIYKLIAELRDLRTKTDDWYAGLKFIHDHYSYKHYPSNCHVIPNHAVVMLGLLWGDGDFDRSMMITNTAGYDTDCNAANVGCILGVRNGLAAFDGKHDWRGPVADRVLMPTADGGSCISDAVTIAAGIENTGRRLRGLPPALPKGGSRFHFSHPGSVQAFKVTADSAVTAKVDNPDGALRIAFDSIADGQSVRVSTPTFASPAEAASSGYSMTASPTLYPGQPIRAKVENSGKGPVSVSLVIAHYDAGDALVVARGTAQTLKLAEMADLDWVCPDTAGYPIGEVGIEISESSASGVVKLQSLHWSGAPTCIFKRTEGKASQRAFVEGGCASSPFIPGEFIIVTNHGRGLLSTGTRDWTDYTARAKIQPRLIRSFGLAARVQGLRRFVAVVVGPGQSVRLVETLHTDRTIAEAPFAWEYDVATIPFEITVNGNSVTAVVGGSVRLAGTISPLLDGGGVALVCEEGLLSSGPITVQRK